METVPYFYKRLPKIFNAGIQLDNGINVSSMDYTDPTQTLASSILARVNRTGGALARTPFPR